MFFNARKLSVLIALITTIFFSMGLWLIGQKLSEFLILLLIYFIFTSITVWGILECFIFNEIKKINTLLERVKKKDYAFSKEILNSSPTPLNKLKKEIAEFAHKKQQEIEELKKLETFRREFLADVSHELKTPIFAAQGFVHTLIDGAMDDPAVRDKFLAKAAHSLDGLNMLVQDLITISQLEIGEIKMHFTNFDLQQLTEDIFDQLEEAAKERNTKLKFYKYNPRSCYVYADKMRIGQVMTNLIVNAIKHGKDNGNVVVYFSIEGEEVSVSVKDDGPGIEPKHQKRIFERFYRVDKSRSKDKGGTGLGLAIVKHIIEAHGYKVNVISEPGEGTIFSFRLKKGKVLNESAAVIK